MKTLPAILLISVFMNTLLAQQTNFYETYDWEKNPAYTVASGEDRDIIGYKEKKVVEFSFSDDDKLTEYFLEHRIIWLNSDEKIEEFNKIYLPHSSTSRLLVSKARVLSKAGKIQELDSSKILTAEDEETKRQYKYFAFEGITKGSFIEYVYVVERHPGYRGTRISLQSSYDKMDVDFDLYSPSNLIFKCKSYNGLKAVEHDSLSTEKQHWSLYLDTINGLKEEDRAAYEASKQFMIYKLDRNTYNNLQDITSYAKVSENIYAFYHQELSKKQQNKLRKFIEKTGVSSSGSDIEKIRTIENFIKTNFYISTIKEKAYEDFDAILENKVANEEGVIKLYTAVFRELAIKYEIVLTSNRYKLKFDNEFEAHNFLTDYLLYFPQIKAYMSPDVSESRLGFPPPRLADNYGLFIKEVSIGDFKSGVGKIKYIAPVGFKETHDNIIMNVTFNSDDITLTHLNIERAMSGYSAMYFQPFMDFIKEEDKNDLTAQFIRSIHKDVEIKNKELHNAAPEFFGVKPFKVTADASSDYFIQKAGNKYLFKVGELIGSQMEMYQDKTRTLPIEEEYKRSYHRVITVKLPEGYVVSNLDAISIDNAYEKDGESLFYFKSFYKIDGNKLIITANEYYNCNIVSVDLYEHYRKVINSAADFNKITLVLVPGS